jgi:antibiotic biosynthesis monooxygenase (ABM) superfamily enzyme
LRENTFATENIKFKKASRMKTKARIIASLKIWAVIYPSITLFLLLFGEQLGSLALYQRTFVLTIVLVPWVVFVGVPMIDAVVHSFSTGKTSSQK